MHNGRCPVEVVSGVPVVAAPEEIDMISAPELRSALLEAAAHGHGTLVVDMTETQFCDSSGVHTLLAAHERAQAEGGELLLVISATSVTRVFEITGLDRIVRNFPSLDEALAQTSADADGSSGHRRADGAPEGGEHNRRAAGTRPPTSSTWQLPGSASACLRNSARYQLPSQRPAVAARVRCRIHRGGACRGGLFIHRGALPGPGTARRRPRRRPAPASPGPGRRLPPRPTPPWPFRSLRGHLWCRPP